MAISKCWRIYTFVASWIKKLYLLECRLSVCLSVCLYICSFHWRICWKAKLIRSSYIWTIFYFASVLIKFGHVTRVAYICFEANVRNHMPNYWGLFCPISHPLASGTHVTTCRSYNELYGKYHIHSLEKVRGENCVLQDDDQLHKALINFTWMKTDLAVFMWHLIEMTSEIHDISYMKWTRWRRVCRDAKWTYFANAFFVILYDVLLTHSLPSLMQL
jgi:hypothetical protein